MRALTQGHTSNRNFFLELGILKALITAPPFFTIVLTFLLTFDHTSNWQYAKQFSESFLRYPYVANYLFPITL